MMGVKEKDALYVAGTYGRFDIEIVSGKGSLVYDDNGKEYIDFATGIAVNSFGVCDEEWVAAVSKQAAMLQHTSNLYYTRPGAELAEMLCNKTGFKKVFFSNSGAEANECAIKAARKYAHDNRGENISTIITLNNSFHGRTLTTLSATGQDALHTNFAPFTEGFVHIPANDIAALNAAVEQYQPAAVMFEPVQGEGGVNPLTQEFVDALKRLQEQDILLIADEVQTGNGRTGELYAYMNFGFMPDILSTAKGLGGGLPIGATMFNEKTENVLTKGTHGSTFGANPVCAAGALSVIKRIDEKLLADVRAKSEYIFNTLSGKEGIKSVSGMGLMIGLLTEKPASEVVAACAEKGLLVITAHEKVRLLPALNVPMELVEKACDIIAEVCGE